MSNCKVIALTNQKGGVNINVNIKMNISRFMQRITFWKMDNMKELSARNCGKRFTQSVWQQELNSHPKSVRIGHTF